jgi:hypothetical protein
MKKKISKKIVKKHIHKKITSKKRQNKEIQTILIGLFVILIIATAVITNYETNCGDNEECFDRAFFTCTKATVIGNQDNNIFQYTILEKKDENCLVNIELIKVNPELDDFTKQRFESRSMNCLLPMEEGFTTDNLNLCEGPLKEAIYEVTIQKMYNLLAQNLGEIISQMRQ